MSGTDRDSSGSAISAKTSGRYRTSSTKIREENVDTSLAAAKTRIFLCCPLCTKKSTPTKLFEHLVSDHKIPIERELLDFDDPEEFNAWKTYLENKSGIFFDVQKSVGVGTPWIMVSEFVCPMVGKKSIKRERLGMNTLGGYCPAGILVEIQKTKKTEKYRVVYISTHVGHECGSELIQMKLCETPGFIQKAKRYPKLFIADGAGNNMLYDPQQFGCQLDLLTNDDIISIDRRFFLMFKNMKCKKNQCLLDTSDIEPWVRWNVSSEQNKKELVVIFFHDIQRELLLKFGSKCVCVNGGCGPNIYTYNLTSVVVLDDSDRAIPVAFLISKAVTEAVIKHFFEVIADSIGTVLKTSMFVSGMTNVYYDAWVKVFPRPFKRLYSKWHVMSVLENNLKEVSDRRLQNEALRLLFKEQDETMFKCHLDKAVEDFCTYKGQISFYQYFDCCDSNDSYDEIGICTNIHLEVVQKNIKRVFADTVNSARLEKPVVALMYFSKDVIFRMLDCEKNSKLLEQNAFSENNILKCVPVGQNMWDVNLYGDSSSTVFRIEKLRESSNCIYSFFCTCKTSAIKWDVCEHICFIVSDDDLQDFRNLPCTEHSLDAKEKISSLEAFPVNKEYIIVENEFHQSDLISRESISLRNCSKEMHASAMKRAAKLALRSKPNCDDTEETLVMEIFPEDNENVKTDCQFDQLPKNKIEPENLKRCKKRVNILANNIVEKVANCSTVEGLKTIESLLSNVISSIDDINMLENGMSVKQTVDHHKGRKRKNKIENMTNPPDRNVKKIRESKENKLPSGMRKIESEWELIILDGTEKDESAVLSGDNAEELTDQSPVHLLACTSDSEIDGSVDSNDLLNTSDPEKSKAMQNQPARFSARLSKNDALLLSVSSEVAKSQSKFPVSNGRRRRRKRKQLAGAEETDIETLQNDQEVIHESESKDSPNPSFIPTRTAPTSTVRPSGITREKFNHKKIPRILRRGRQVMEKERPPCIEPLAASHKNLKNYQTYVNSRRRTPGKQSPTKLQNNTQPLEIDHKEPLSEHTLGNVVPMLATITNNDEAVYNEKLPVSNASEQIIIYNMEEHSENDSEPATFDDAQIIDDVDLRAKAQKIDIMPPPLHWTKDPLSVREGSTPKTRCERAQFLPKFMSTPFDAEKEQRCSLKKKKKPFEFADIEIAAKSKQMPAKKLVNETVVPQNEDIEEERLCFESEEEYQIVDTDYDSNESEAKSDNERSSENNQDRQIVEVYNTEHPEFSSSQTTNQMCWQLVTPSRVAISTTTTGEPPALLPF